MLRIVKRMCRIAMSIW